MNIVVLGATGIVGKAIVKEALQQGHQVTVLTRNAQKLPSGQAGLKVVEGLVTDRKVLRQVLNGQDAVIQTLGIGGKGDGKTTTFVSSTNQIIMEEMEQLGLRRLIAISVIGAGDSLKFLPWIYKKMILPLFQRWFIPIIEDKNRMEKCIKESHLDWTVVRCTTVKHQAAKGNVVASLDGKGLKFSITDADLAKFFINQLSDRQFLHQMPTVSN